MINYIASLYRILKRYDLFDKNSIHLTYSIKNLKYVTPDSRRDLMWNLCNKSNNVKLLNLKKFLDIVYITSNFNIDDTNIHVLKGDCSHVFARSIVQRTHNAKYINAYNEYITYCNRGIMDKQWKIIMKQWFSDEELVNDIYLVLNEYYQNYG